MINMVKVFLKSIITVPIMNPLFMISSNVDTMPISAVSQEWLGKKPDWFLCSKINLIRNVISESCLCFYKSLDMTGK